MTREEMVKSVLIFSTGLFLLAFTLGPFIWMIWISLADRADFLITGKVSYSLANYHQVLSAHSLHFLDYLKNSLWISTITATVVTVFSSMAAYAVSRMRFPGRSVVPLLILAMSMFPQISIVGYLFEMFSRMGLINSHMALILPYIAWTIPIALWINMSYFTQIPLDLDRAALVDGASRMKVLYKIVFPLALPGIFSSALLVFIACFNEFLFAIMLTIDYTAQTLPVGIALFQGLHGEIPWGNLMAASAIASIPLVILTLIFQRYIVAGLMGGAVKG
jgi:multiple sugar transport system permease protein